jgi:hypothetical protein
MPDGDFGQIDHVVAARNALRSTNGLLTAWELNFLSSMLWARFPSPKQLSTLDLLVAKAKMRKPRGRRRGRAGR